MSESDRSEPDSVVWLIDDKGREHPHEILEVLDVDDHAYAALLVLEVGPDGKAHPPERTIMNFMRLEYDSDGEEVLVEIHNKREVKRVFQAWTDYLNALDL